MNVSNLSIREIFSRAVEMEDADELEAFIDQACQGDKDVHRKVEDLLAAHQSAGRFMNGTGLSPATVDRTPLAEAPGDCVGPYKLREQIGEGGFGVVYVAEQTEPVSRKVALKIIKPGMDTKDVIGRFEAERQALALMDHPNVAKVLDAGATQSGRPYFVMELVHGIPLTEFCDEQSLSNHERLKLLIDVCRAVQHAHQKGIIHRDLKPSNIMVTMHDDRPVPKVIDFGVAKALSKKLTEKTVYTSYGQMVGTPLYMSPEQAQMSGLDLDTRSDIYSLGVLLYELLTGTTPFNKDTIENVGYDELRRIILEDDPPRPSVRVSTLNAEVLSTASVRRRIDHRKLGQSLRGELDWIVMKALEKDRGRRYETASKLAEDIDNYLNDAPVEACPPSLSYKFRKFARRNRMALTTSSLVALALILGTIASTWQAFRASAAEAGADQQRNAAVLTAEQAKESEQAAQAERDSAVAAREELREVLYASEMVQAGYTIQLPAGFQRVKQLLKPWVPEADKRDLRGWEWHYLNRQLHQELAVFHGHERWVSEVDFHPDGIRLASAGAADQRIRIWDTKQEKQIGVVRGTEKGGMKAVRWSPDGTRFAGSCGDSKIRVWDAKTLQELFVLQGQTQPAMSIAWSPDGSRLAAGSLDNTLRIWDTTIDSQQFGQIVANLPAVADTVLWSPDGKQLLTHNERRSVCRRWNAETLEDLGIMYGPGSPRAVAWTPDGTRIAIAGTTYDGSPNLAIWNAAELGIPEPLAEIHAECRSVSALAWSPDGTRLAVGSTNRTATIWDIKEKKILKTLRGHTSTVVSLDWNPDGTQLATSSQDGTVRLWDGTISKQPSSIFGLSTDLNSAKWSPDGSKSVVVQMQQMKVSNAANGEKLITINSPHRIRRCDWSPDGSKIAVRYADRQQSLGVVDLETGDEIARFVPVLESVQRQFIRSVVWHPDSRQIAISYIRGSVFVWNSATDKLEATINIDAWADQALSWSPDGQRLAIASKKECTLWDSSNWKQTSNLTPQEEFYRTVRFSPDGKWLATGSNDGRVRLFDATTCEEPARLEGHLEHITSVSWSPDGRRLASTGDDGIVILWDVTGHRQVLAVPVSKNGCNEVYFHPDGQRLLAIGNDFQQYFLDATPLPDIDQAK